MKLDKFERWFYDKGGVEPLDKAVDSFQDFMEDLVFEAYTKGWEDYRKTEEALKELAEFDLDT